MSKKIFLLIGTPLIILGLLVEPILNAVPVSALNTVSSTSSDDTKTKSYAYYKAFEACLVADEMNHDIGTTDASNPKNWRNWINNAPVSADYYIYPSGSSDCNAVFPDALNFWGYNSETFLRDMGYKINSSGTTYSISGVTLSAKFTSLIQSKVYGGASVSADPVVKYDLLWSAYTQASACNAQEVGPLSSQPPSITALAKNNAKGGDGYTYEIVKPYNGSSPPVDTVYKTNQTGRSAGSRGSGYQNIIFVSTLSSKTNCLDIVGQINSASSAAYSYAITGAIASTKSSYLAAIENLASSQCKGNLICVSGWAGSFNTCFDNYVNSSTFQYPKFDTATIANCMATSHPGQDNAIKAALDGVAVSTTNNTNADPCTNDPTSPGCKTTSCSIDGIGWIVCPVMSFMGSLADTAFNFLASNFLQVNADMLNTDPKAVDSSGSPIPTSTYTAWQVMRNAANIVFVIAFLIIIFSQLTSIGIGNYGIKKMLPRLIVAAILVNLSFFVCQVAVDLSNILGYSLKHIFDMLSKYTQTPDSVSSGSASGNALGIAAIVITLLAGGITLAFAISVPVLLAVLLALLMIILILFAREALIVLLVVISPLAFVAYLLPNTEQWFKKWQKMFMSLLLVFPVIAVVFGASSLAAGIIKASSKDDMIQLIAMGVAIVPLFVVPSLLKGSMAAAGTVGAKLAGMSSKANGRIKGRVKDTTRTGQFGKDMVTQQNRRRALSQAGVNPRRGGARNPLNWSAMVNKKVNQHTGGFGDRSAAGGIALANKLEEEEVSNAEMAMRQGVDPSQLVSKTKDSLEEAIRAKDVVKARAAQRILLSTGDKGLETLHSTLEANINTQEAKESEVGSNLRTDLVRAGVKGRDNVLNKWSLANGTVSIGDIEMTDDHIKSLNDVELAGQSTKILDNAGTNGFIDQITAQRIMSNTNVWKDLSQEKKDIIRRYI